MITTKNYSLDKMQTSEIEAVWQEVKDVYIHHFQFLFDNNYLSKKCKDAYFARLRVIRDNNKAVGVFLMFGHKIKVNNKNIIVYRASAAIDSEYRTRNNLTNFMFSNIIPQIIKNCFRKQYIVESFIHTSSFSITQKSLARVYPSPDNATPPEIELLMKGVSAANILIGHNFRFENPFLSSHPYSTAQTPEEIISWQQKIQKDKYVKFYHEQGAMPGNKALIGIVPASVKNVVLSLLKTRKARQKRQAEKKQEVKV